MKAIGGYLPLELSKKREYHTDAIAVNTGRNALELILKSGKYNSLHIPYYTCHVLLQPIKNAGIKFEYYSLNENFEPIFDFSSLRPDQGFLYTNYFGLKDDYINLISSYSPNIIIDNAQAFYSRPLLSQDTFYSVRKFFGVPDGAYLYTTSDIDLPLDNDVSHERSGHLLMRIDKSAEDGYPLFATNDNLLDGMPVRRMSGLTRALLASIDYQEIAGRRRANYNYLKDNIGEWNELRFNMNEHAVPLAYPFLGRGNNQGLRETLTRSRVYTAQYWKEVLSIVGPESIEHKYASEIIPLPIDQNLVKEDLDRIIKLIRNEY